jgi:hypothetical protein
VAPRDEALHNLTQRSFVDSWSVLEGGPWLCGHPS